MDKLRCSVELQSTSTEQRSHIEALLPVLFNKVPVMNWCSSRWRFSNLCCRTSILERGMCVNSVNEGLKQEMVQGGERLNVLVDLIILSTTRLILPVEEGIQASLNALLCDV
jgi:hypothetical protein